ncbi:PAS domain-containing hybrid sensor histidine kinase/response regulator [Trinickia fusca]|uniref:histidine kinase n=1 Tax=Trinickia fusca TaxID=2419777 RepID=A0A494XAR7_9BURK|nr:ATP-binding protein [Trinickia fusca]RKP45204.1 PAS domain S-box protein [Trinickia fusca]
MRSEPSAPARESQAVPPPSEQVVPPEERFRILVDSVQDYAIFMLDPDGCIVSWNVGAQKIKGYTAQEVIGRHFSIFYPPEDVANGKPARTLTTAATVGRIEDEGWRVRKDGSLFWANVVITALYTTHGGEPKLRGYAKVTRDMTERKRLRDLEAASEHMNEFLATLAHELRNPLAPVSNALSVMKLEPLLSPTLKQCRDMIDRQISHLTRLVDDLLDAGRITTGKIALRLAPVDLRDVTAHAIEMMRPLLGLRQQVVQVEAPEAGVFVNGDTARLIQVIQNLLNNASKFSERGDPIGVTIAEENRTFAVVRVTDRGSGIEPEAIGSIFDLFVQADTRLERKESGLGIGLTICRWLVEMHGGAIAAASDGPGCGAAFTVRLPLLGVQLAANDAASAASRTGPREGEKEGLSILIVDDNGDSADSMAMLLRMKGHHVHVAYSGAQALAFAAGASVVHVALIDIAMPGADGFSVLHELKQASGFEPTLFAAMTGFGQDADIERSLSQGFDMHLTKPVQLPLIEALLQRADDRRAGR